MAGCIPFNPFKRCLSPSVNPDYTNTTADTTTATTAHRQCDTSELLLQASRYEVRRYHSHLVASVNVTPHHQKTSSKRNNGNAEGSSSKPESWQPQEGERRLRLFMAGDKGMRKRNDKWNCLRDVQRPGTSGDSHNMIQQNYDGCDMARPTDLIHQPLPLHNPITLSHSPLPCLTATHQSIPASHKSKDHFHIDIQFTLPYAYRTLTDLPFLPSDDSGIIIKEVSAEDYAVMTVRGQAVVAASRAKVGKTRERLLRLVRDKCVAERFEVSPSEWAVRRYERSSLCGMFTWTSKTEVAIRLVEV